MNIFHDIFFSFIKDVLRNKNILDLKTNKQT